MLSPRDIVFVLDLSGSEQRHRNLGDEFDQCGNPDI